MDDRVGADRHVRLDVGRRRIDDRDARAISASFLLLLEIAATSASSLRLLTPRISRGSSTRDRLDRRARARGRSRTRSGR